MGNNEGIQGSVNARNLAVGKGAQANYYEGAKPEAPSVAPAEVTRVLLVCANPFDTGRLRFDAEAREIQRVIEASRYREQIALKTLLATTFDDLRHALLKEPFHIVHFAGHGAEAGLVLENERGKASIVSRETLAEFFHLYRRSLRSLRAVVLNACYSAATGGLVAPGVPYTIGIEGTLSDRAAIAFSRGFYDAIGAGQPVDVAYEYGLATVRGVSPTVPFNSTLNQESV